jgi:DNA-binding response OmpR family regulator
MRPPKLLIVEDHADTQFFLSTVLKMKGYWPLSHTTSQEALGDASSYDNLRAALVDLSLEMPVEEFIPALRRLPGLEALPIILISGRDWTQAQAQSVGAQAFLRKPCDVATLLGTLKSVLGD